MALGKLLKKLLWYYKDRAHVQYSWSSTGRKGLEKVFGVFHASDRSLLIPMIIDRTEFVFVYVVCIFLKQSREKQRNRASTRYFNVV